MASQLVPVIARSEATTRLRLLRKLRRARSPPKLGERRRKQSSLLDAVKKAGLLRFARNDDRETRARPWMRGRARFDGGGWGTHSSSSASEGAILTTGDHEQHQRNPEQD